MGCSSRHSVTGLRWRQVRDERARRPPRPGMSHARERGIAQPPGRGHRGRAWSASQHHRISTPDVKSGLVHTKAADGLTNVEAHGVDTVAVCQARRARGAASRFVLTLGAGGAEAMHCPTTGAVLALPHHRGNAKDGIPRVWVERANAEAGCVGVGDRGGAQTWGAGQLPSNRRQLSRPQVAGRERQGHGAAHGIRAGLGRLRWSSDWAGLGVGTCVSTDPPR